MASSDTGWCSRPNDAFHHTTKSLPWLAVSVMSDVRGARGQLASHIHAGARVRCQQNPIPAGWHVLHRVLLIPLPPIVKRVRKGSGVLDGDIFPLPRISESIRRPWADSVKGFRSCGVETKSGSTQPGVG